MIKQAMTIFASLQYTELEQVQNIAMEILFQKVSADLDEAQLVIFQQKWKAGDADLMDWLAAQGIDL